MDAENEEFQIPPPPVDIPKPPLPEIIYRKDPEYPPLDKGKIPPQAVDLEEVVIGALMIDKRAAPEIMGFMTPDVFYKNAHQNAFQAIQTLYEKELPIDLLTVVEELRRTGKLAIVGGEYYLIQLTQKVSSAAHIEFHSRIILQKYVLRRMIQLGNVVIEEAYNQDPDIFDLMDKFENDVLDISNTAQKGKKESGPADPGEELREKVRLKREGKTIGYPSGIEEFDNWAGGFLKRWLFILGARPGMGKTSFIVAVIYHLAFERGVKVAFFSLEMAAIDIKYRLAARILDIPFSRINLGELTDEELEEVTEIVSKIEDYGINIIDNVRNLSKITVETKKLKEEGFEIFFLDYLQLVEISGTSKDLTGEMVIITRTFKSLKNDLNIPFIALSQIDRIVDKRPGHRPLISDLKQASSIEQDADIVAFIVRPEYYNENKSKIPLPPGKPNPEFIAQFIIAKGRSTGLKDFDIYLDLSKFILKSGHSVPF